MLLRLRQALPVITALLGVGGRVWVIDVGRSYEKTCQMLGGEFIEFTPTRPISLNPFTFIQSLDSSLDMLKPLLASMARPQGIASDEEMAWLENDYFKNATAIAAYENSDYNVILGQKPESIDQLKLSQRLQLDGYSERLFKDLKKTEHYSECILKSPQGLSVHRIIFDPYSRILYSSKGEEFAAVKQLQAQGRSLQAAIAEVSER